MSKMKHLLRKLHIGSETRPVINPDPSPSPSSSTSSTIRAVDQVAEQRAVGISSESSSGGATGAVDFNFLEEEFQVQLALAISASDPSSKRDDPETVQIKAAKRMSLGCPPSVSADDTETLAEFLSLRYWNYNSVNYDEKVMDGFYDVYGITSNSMTQGKMPLLVDLQAISTSDEFDYEVVLVNRSIDPELQKLEERAYAVSMECGVSEQNGLIQIIADLVVGKMGGAVENADEMLKRWTSRSYELRNSLNTIVLPLGRLDIGLSRHRALLFKVLADRINLPCMMVKGSYYTGTDEGAVNLIKFGDGSEYIIDLMGAPGTLIPAEAPCSHLPNSGLDGRCFENAMETSKDSSLVLGNESGSSDVTLDLGKISKTESSMLEQTPCIGFRPEDVNKNLTEKREVEKFELDFGNLLPSLPQPHEGSSETHEKVSSAQKIKVKDVSKYVISAAKDPEFAQKLHAVLLESGAAPPANLFLNINFQDVGNQRVLNQVHLLEGITIDDGTFSHPDNSLPKHEQSLMPSTSTGLQSLNNHGYDIHRKQSEEPTDKQKNVERSTNETQVLVHSDTTSEGFVLVSGGGSSETMQIDGAYTQMASADSSRMFREDSNMEQSHESSLPVAAGPSQAQLGEVAEWEIPWEDLQIGERIGIGSYGEVYHADWNGTEVAVKKFLVQDFTGYALVQFKCEVEIMLRLRHPNVVLFMGAVTRPPNLSILTEFLPRGSLYRLLHRPNHHLDEKRRLRMALDVAKGMNYLHTSHPPIVHRDLKSPNLLVDKNWVVKVCDFGLSRVKHHTFLSSKSTAGTPEWMAPEVLRNERANEKCDIYSFGVILWELTTLRVPWSGLNPMQVVGAVGFQNRRLDIPEDVDSSIAQIICDCWQSDPQLRPTFAQLIHRLRRVPHLYARITDSTSEITD